MKTHAQTGTVPHLMIDARPLTGARNGITRVVEQLMAAWPSHAGFKTTLVSNRPIVSNAVLPNGIDRLEDRHLFARIPGTLWMTLRVQALARRLGATHFLGTQHVLPLWRTEHLRQGVIVHDLVFDLFPHTMAFGNRMLSRAFAPGSIRRADAIFCVSQTTRADLLRRFDGIAQNAWVCYPGRDLTPVPAQVEIPLRRETQSLLVVGSVEPRKNISRFLEAFFLLAEHLPTVRLDLVSGDNWGQTLSEQVRARIQQHPRVRLHQRISDSALQALYSDADFLIFPSLYEGFGLPVLEAIGRCGVIANDIPIFQELAGHISGIHLLDFRAPPQDIAQKLDNLLIHADRKPACIVRGEFAWSTFVDKILTGMGLLPPGVAATSSIAAP